MDDPFRPVFEGLKQVADGLIMANQGIKTLADAVLATREEDEDLRETVHRLESLVIAQGNDLRALRDRLDSRE